ncbi:MAG: Holliday junction resolvase RuvX, partial [Chromatiales bacterium]
MSLQLPSWFSTLPLKNAGTLRPDYWASTSRAFPRMPVTPDLPLHRTILAFDFGRRRIGVAVGQDVTGSASPLGVVANRADGVDHAAIAALIKEWCPTGIVVGMPSHADGSRSEMQEPVEAFIEELRR